MRFVFVALKGISGPTPPYVEEGVAYRTWGAGHSRNPDISPASLCPHLLWHPSLCPPPFPFRQNWTQRTPRHAAVWPSGSPLPMALPLLAFLGLHPLGLACIRHHPARPPHLALGRASPPGQ